MKNNEEIENYLTKEQEERILKINCAYDYFIHLLKNTGSSEYKNQSISSLGEASYKAIAHIITAKKSPLKKKTPSKPPQ
jgi:hypothetical protein